LSHIAETSPGEYKAVADNISIRMAAWPVAYQAMAHSRQSWSVEHDAPTQQWTHVFRSAGASPAISL